MKFLKLSSIVFLIISLTVLSAFAQSKASKSGKVSPTPTPKTVEISDAETLTTDFKNFTYSEPGFKQSKSFTLKNGVFNFSNVKNKEFRNFQFRKVFYFDVTGDKKTEAIVHILSDTCENCQERSLFYVFSAMDKKPVQIFSTATGSQAKCGLKEIIFQINEITLDVFGDCIVNFSALIIAPNSTKKDLMTRFIFTRKDRDFIEKSKENIPFIHSEIPNFRPQIRFGE